MSIPGRRGRPGLGCVGRILAFLLLGTVAVLLIYAVFAPWAFFLGGSFHPLAFWQGWGRLHPSAGADYAVFVRMWPTPGSRSGFPSVTGTADLCTARGERFSLRLGGSFLDKHPWRIDSDQRPMSLYMYTRPFFSSFTTERRPRFDLHGAWHNPDLVVDDHGTLSTAFLPDGRAYLGPPRNQPAARGSATVTLRAGGHSEFDAACRALAR
jgi:hypothetical protein